MSRYTERTSRGGLQSKALNIVCVIESNWLYRVAWPRYIVYVYIFLALDRNELYPIVLGLFSLTSKLWNFLVNQILSASAMLRKKKGDHENASSPFGYQPTFG